MAFALCTNARLQLSPPTALLTNINSLFFDPVLKISQCILRPCLTELCSLLCLLVFLLFLFFLFFCHWIILLLSHDRATISYGHLRSGNGHPVLFYTVILLHIGISCKQNIIYSYRSALSSFICLFRMHQARQLILSTPDRFLPVHRAHP